MPRRPVNSDKRYDSDRKGSRKRANSRDLGQDGSHKRSRESDDAHSQGRQSASHPNRNASIISETPLLKAKITESNGEISCSVEETNRIRAQLGLKPLTVRQTSSSATLSNASAFKAESNADGEISASVEETNRIRISLGMKPLSAGLSASSKRDQEAKANFEQATKTTEQERDTKAIRLRIDQARARRLEQQEAREGLTLTSGASAEEAQALSAAEWVRQTKAKAAVAAAAKRDAKEMAKTSTKGGLKGTGKGKGKDTSANEIGDELEGVEVQHRASAFETGEEGVILTLADSRILSHDATTGALVGVADSGDVLENTLLREQEQREKRDRLARRGKQANYSGYDDDEFDINVNAMGVNGDGDGVMVTGSMSAVGKRGILSHYDVDRREEVRDQPKLRLGAGGKVQGSDKESGENDTYNASHRTLVVDGTSTGSGDIVSEYYTNEEYAEVRFKGKKKKKKTGKDSQASTRVTLIDDVEESVKTAAKTAVRPRRKGGLTFSADAANPNPDTESSAADAAGGAGGALKGSSDRMTRAALELQRGTKGGQDKEMGYREAVARANAKSARYHLDSESAQEALLESRLEAQEVRGSGKDMSSEQMKEGYMVAAKGGASFVMQIIAGKGKKKPNKKQRGAPVATMSQTFGSSSQSQNNDNDNYYDVGDNDAKAAMDMDDSGSEWGSDDDDLWKSDDIEIGAKRAADADTSKVVFTTTTEFSARLQSRLGDEQGEQKQHQQQRQEEGDEPEITSISGDAMSAPVTGGNMDAQMTGAETEAKEQMPTRSTADKGGWRAGTGDPSCDQVPASLSASLSASASSSSDGALPAKNTSSATSLSAALAILKGTGELGHGAVEQMAGRNKDSRVQNPSERLGDIKLEYRDEFGRLLSQKEAFRQLTYKFHGKGPGKKAQDKRIQKFKAEQAAKAADKTTSGTLAALQNAQRATQTAGVALAGGQLAATNAAMTTEMIRELARQKLEKKRAALLKKQKG